MLAKKQELMQYSSLRNANENLFLYDFIMGGSLRCILNSMRQIFMSDALAAEIVKNHAIEISQPDLSEHFQILFSKLDKDVVIFKSAFLEYIRTGNIFMLGRSIQLTREERKAHLEQLLDYIEEGNCRLTILNDENPLLDIHYFNVSVYMSPTAVFASFSKGNDECIVHYTSHRVISSFNQFFDHILSMPENFLISGKEAEKFIRRGMEITL